MPETESDDESESGEAVKEYEKDDESKLNLSEVYIQGILE